MKEDIFHLDEEEEDGADSGKKPERKSTPQDGWETDSFKPRHGRISWLWLILLLALLGAAVFWVLWQTTRQPSPGLPGKEKPPVEKVAAVPAPAAEAPAAPRTVSAVEVPLSESDEAVRDAMGPLSSDARFASLLKEKDFIRRFVAVVDDIARGESFKPLVESLAPKKGFSVIKRGNSFTMDPEGYRRYDAAVGLFLSLDDAALAEQYGRFRSLFDEAYRELGHASGNFSDSLVRAVNQVLAVPVRDAPIALYEKPISFGYSDESLEKLTDAQKHFLRLGPGHLRRIKQKLHRLIELIGLSGKLQYRP